MKLRLATFAIALAVLCDGQSRVYGAAADKFQETAAFLAASLTRFLDDNVSLSATTRLTISNPSGDAPPSSLELGTALDRGKMRFDLDLTSGANKILNTGLPQLGIRRMMFIGYPDNPMRVVFPDLKSYVEIPIGNAGGIKDKADVAAGRLERKFVGEEKIDGMAAKKYQLHRDGAADQAYVWEATGLNNLPVRLQTVSGGQAYTFSFSNVREGRLDPRVFAIPTAFTKTEGFQGILNAGIAQLTAAMNKALRPGQ
ncbi:MAG: hypothetical protein ISQ14_07350 [Verrucomicrobiae bacterium]|jgi:hypothetical protein|nr:hypothetical protein [Verrucomicrobiae bacterium]